MSTLFIKCIILRGYMMFTKYSLFTVLRKNDGFAMRNVKEGKNILLREIIKSKASSLNIYIYVKFTNQAQPTNSAGRTPNKPKSRSKVISQISANGKPSKSKRKFYIVL